VAPGNEYRDEDNKGGVKLGLRSRSQMTGVCLYTGPSDRVSIHASNGFMFLAAWCNAGLCASLPTQAAKRDGPSFSALKNGDIHLHNEQRLTSFLTKKNTLRLH
jgi:hypothetical protein